MSYLTMRGAFNITPLPNGSAITVSMTGAPIPATVWTRPGSGDTVTVSYSTDNGVNFNTWPGGAVTVYTEDILNSGITHIRFQRTAGTGATSTAGVC